VISYHPARPWWIYISLSKEAAASIIPTQGFTAPEKMEITVGWFRTCDQLFVTVKQSTFASLILRGQNKESFFLPEKLEIVEDVDQRNPLPHPGFRAGQVWGDLQGETCVIADSKEVRRLSSEGRLVFLLSDSLFQDRAPWASAA
jgi:hypothetical protein